MIKILRRKFITIAMLSLFVVLAIIVTTINLINYKNIISGADDILSLLDYNDGHFPMQEDIPNAMPNVPDGDFPNEAPSEIPNGEPDNLPDDKRESNPNDMQSMQNGHKNDWSHMSPELPYESRFFSVLFSTEGVVLLTDTDNITAIDQYDAVDMAQQAINSNKAKGFIGNYRYVISKSDEDSRVIFLDCTRDLKTFKNFLLASIGISFTGLIAVFILILLFSGRIIKPISESYEKQKRFITDAGHEIKTPVTIIDADAEVLEMELGNNEWVQDIRKQTMRLGALTNDLIYLSRMEEDNVKLNTIEFPVSDVVSEVATSFQSLAISKEKVLTLNIDSMLSMEGDEKAIRQLISILLDNAMKYSTDKSEIVVRLKKYGKWIKLSVSNSTNDISKDNISNLFERFYRTDSSRNSETGGYGIGLSIAKAITVAHKGKISANQTEAGRLSITVELQR